MRVVLEAFRWRATHSEEKCCAQPRQLAVEQPPTKEQQEKRRYGAGFSTVQVSRASASSMVRLRLADVGEAPRHVVAGG